MHTLRSLLTVASILALAVQPAVAFSDEPLSKVAIEPVRALVEAVGINNWLNANYKKMSPEQTQGAREHLHALIDSRVKDHYAKTGTILPKESDPILAMLYSWAARLGVYGADSVYAALRGTYIVNPPAGPQPPDGIAVELQRNSLTITSSTGEWQASVPYYFFIFALRSEVGTDSRHTEAAVISTGSAPDVAPPGYSQSTLAVFFTRGANLKSFETEWAERLQIPLQSEPIPVGQTKYRSRTAYDERNRLHKEIVFASSGRGSFAILYSGLDGTYQANRPHFLNFLELLKVPE